MKYLPLIALTLLISMVGYALADSVSVNGTATSDIGFCYQADTPSCFTGTAVPNTNNRIGFRVGTNFGAITSGYRFPSVTIPQGATISSATFTYTAFDTDSTSPPTVRMHAEAVDNSPTFATTGANSPDTVSFGGSRATTSASVLWTMVSQTIGVESTSPDITSVIQEVVDRAGWSSGNAISIIIGTHTLVDNFNAQNNNGSATLDITYTVEEAPATTASAASLRTGSIQLRSGSMNLR